MDIKYLFQVIKKLMMIFFVTIYLTTLAGCNKSIDVTYKYGKSVDEIRVQLSDYQKTFIEDNDILEISSYESGFLIKYAFDTDLIKLIYLTDDEINWSIGPYRHIEILKVNDTEWIIDYNYGEGCYILDPITGEILSPHELTLKQLSVLSNGYYLGSDYLVNQAYLINSEKEVLKTIDIPYFDYHITIIKDYVLIFDGAYEMFSLFSNDLTLIFQSESLNIDDLNPMIYLKYIDLDGFVFTVKTDTDYDIKVYFDGTVEKPYTSDYIPLENLELIQKTIISFENGDSIYLEYFSNDQMFRLKRESINGIEIYNHEIGYVRRIQVNLDLIIFIVEEDGMYKVLGYDFDGQLVKVYTIEDLNGDVDLYTNTRTTIEDDRLIQYTLDGYLNWESEDIENLYYFYETNNGNYLGIYGIEDDDPMPPNTLYYHGVIFSKEGYVINRIEDYDISDFFIVNETMYIYGRQCIDGVLGDFKLFEITELGTVIEAYDLVSVYFSIFESEFYFIDGDKLVVFKLQSSGSRTYS